MPTASYNKFQPAVENLLENINAGCGHYHRSGKHQVIIFKQNAAANDAEYRLRLLLLAA